MFKRIAGVMLIAGAIYLLFSGSLIAGGILFLTGGFLIGASSGIHMAYGDEGSSFGFGDTSVSFDSDGGGGDGGGGD